MATPDWVRQYVNTNFSSNGVMLQDGRDWIEASRRWLSAFLKKNFAIRKQEFKFRQGHYEWSAFALIDGQWWYFSSGDCRFKIMMNLLVRTARDKQDYTGGVNQYVSYLDPGFADNLAILLRR